MEESQWIVWSELASTDELINLSQKGVQVAIIMSWKLMSLVHAKSNHFC